jgi:transcriptional regulator with XRE-family HTH domain
MSAHRALVPLNPILTFSMIVGAALRRLRRRHSITQGDLAAALRMGQSALSKLERGEVEFTTSTLFAAAQAINQIANHPVHRPDPRRINAATLSLTDNAVVLAWPVPVSAIEVLKTAHAAAVDCAGDGVTVLFCSPSRLEDSQKIRVLGSAAIERRLERGERAMGGKNGPDKS